MKTRAHKTLRNTLMSITVLVVIFGAAGVLYIRFTDQTPALEPKLKTTTADQASPVPKPKQPAPNAKEGVSVEAVTSPVARGSNSSISVLTNAGSACSVSVVYSGVASKDSGLAPKTADPYGNVTWAWTVDKTVPVGVWPIKVTCTYHKRSAVVDSSVQVVK